MLDDASTKHLLHNEVCFVVEERLSYCAFAG